MLVLLAGESGLMLLPPCSHPGEAGLEAVVTKPKEDGCCHCRLSCLGSVCVKKALVTSGLLVEQLLTMGGLLALLVARLSRSHWQ